MNRTRKAKAPSVISVRIENPSQFQQIYRKGGMKIMVAVSDDTCPHCVQYKPTWDTLAKTEGRNVHMISMPSSVYNQTPLAKQKEVKGVPTVLYVSPSGNVSPVIEEVEDIRNVTKMTSLLKSNAKPVAIPTNIPIIEPSQANEPEANEPKANEPKANEPKANEPEANEPEANEPKANEPKANEPKANEPVKALQIPGLTDAALPTIPVSQVNVNTSVTGSVNRSRNIVPNKPTNALKPILPGVTTQSNPLTPLPGSPVVSERQTGGYISQTGGNPWSAFMMAAKQAAPAAALLGAYSMIQRSSGLPRPSKSSKSSKTSKTSRRQRRTR